MHSPWWFKVRRIGLDQLLCYCTSNSRHPNRGPDLHREPEGKKRASLVFLPGAEVAHPSGPFRRRLP